MKKIINNKKLRIVIVTILAFLPMILFADTEQEVSFFQGDNAFEDWFMQVFAQIDLQVWDEANLVAGLGRAIGAIGALIYLGYLGYQMQEGARPWEVTPMIRPIIVALILSNWANFCQLIQYPFQTASDPSVTLFNEIQEEAEDRRILRYEKQIQLIDAAIEAKAREDAKIAELEAVENANETDESWWDIGDLEDLFLPIQEWAIRFDFKFQKLVANLIDSFSLSIMRICTYFIFVLQKVWGYVLITLGPIAIGMSLIPGFENSLNAWIAKFININLYSFIAYQIINIGQMMIIGAYNMEIDRMNQIIGEEGVPTDLVVLTNFVTNNGFITTTMFTAVAYLITGILVLMTPSIADSIVSAGGAGIMSKGKRAGGAIASAGNKAVTAGKVASGNAAAAAKTAYNKLTRSKLTPTSNKTNSNNQKSEK